MHIIEYVTTSPYILQVSIRHIRSKIVIECHLKCIIDLDEANENSYNKTKELSHPYYLRKYTGKYSA